LPPEDDEIVVDGIDSEEEPEESEEENYDELSGDEGRDDEIGGGEDGEEPWDEDDLEAEGYARF
jgi:hypothetical protein